MVLGLLAPFVIWLPVLLLVAAAAVAVDAAAVEVLLLLRVLGVILSSLSRAAAYALPKWARKNASCST